jgi:hypothetical protein
VVYNTRNYWGFGLCLLPSIQKTLENTTFRKRNCFLRQVMGHTPTLLCKSERANLNHWTTCVIITTAI